MDPRSQNGSQPKTSLSRNIVEPSGQVTTLAQQQCMVIGAEIKHKQFRKYITTHKEISIKIMHSIQKKLKQHLNKVRKYTNTIWST